METTKGNVVIVNFFLNSGLQFHQCFFNTSFFLNTHNSVDAPLMNYKDKIMSLEKCLQDQKMLTLVFEKVFLLNACTPSRTLFFVMRFVSTLNYIRLDNLRLFSFKKYQETLLNKITAEFKYIYEKDNGSTESHDKIELNNFRKRNLDLLNETRGLMTKVNKLLEDKETLTQELFDCKERLFHAEEKLKCVFSSLILMSFLLDLS